jgi:hypothetical protein
VAGWPAKLQLNDKEKEEKQARQRRSSRPVLLSDRFADLFYRLSDCASTFRTPLEFGRERILRRPHLYPVALDPMVTRGFETSPACGSCFLKHSEHPENQHDYKK